MSIFKSLLLLGLLTYSTQVLSYHPKTGHEPISKLAIEGYNQCFNDTPVSAEAGNLILLGNTAMDYGMFQFSHEQKHLKKAVSVFSPLVRSKNWHFYNPDKTQNTRQGDVEMSFKNLWHNALLGIRLNRQPQDKWLFVGALIHLTEDLSVPAHAIPVYHGPVYTKKWLGEFSSLTEYMREKGWTEGFWIFEMIHDSIDSMAVDKQRLKIEMTKSAKAFCDQPLLKTALSVSKLRDAQARQTLNTISNPIPGCGDISWQHFWQDTIDGDLPAQRYFKKYNTNEGFLRFGEVGVIKDPQGKPLCELTKQHYQDFVHQLHRSAVLHDIALIRWALGQID